MSASFPHQPERMLVVLPADAEAATMATPTLRALRETCPAAHITWLVSRPARAVLGGTGWANRIWTLPLPPRTPRADWQKTRSPRKRSFARLLRRVKAEHFDTAVLLNDRFRAALLTKLVGIPMRVGYERDDNALLLTDRLLALRDRGQVMPVPRVHHYLAFARYLGAASPRTELELALRPVEAQQAAHLLTEAGVNDARRPWVLLSTALEDPDGARWGPEPIAALIEGLIEQYGATVMLAGGQTPRAMREAIHAAVPGELIDLPDRGETPGGLKGIVHQCDLVITGDTLPRYIAAGFGVPTLTLLGARDPRWTQLDHTAEHTLRAPDGHIRSITPAMVLEALDHTHHTTLRPPRQPPQATASPASEPHRHRPAGESHFPNPQ